MRCSPEAFGRANMSGKSATKHLLPGRSTRSLRVTRSPDHEEREEQTRGARGADRPAAAVRRAMSLPSQGTSDMHDDTIVGASAKDPLGQQRGSPRRWTRVDDSLSQVVEAPTSPQVRAQTIAHVMTTHAVSIKRAHEEQDEVKAMLARRHQERASAHDKYRQRLARGHQEGEPAARVPAISWEEPKPAKSRWAMVREQTKKTKTPAFAEVVDKSHGPWHFFLNKPITRKNHFLSLRSLLFA